MLLLPLQLHKAKKIYVNAEEILSQAHQKNNYGNAASNPISFYLRNILIYM